MTDHSASRNLITDVAGLKVGNASSPRLKSGVTVVTADVPFTASVHVMGGAPGTRETDLLAPDKLVDGVDALVLSGGSAFGLDACSGVSDGLLQAGRGHAVGPARVPIVPGAILFDLLNGGEKELAEAPYRALGREAYDRAAPDFEIGTEGAGYGALTATLKGGLGSASTRYKDYTVGALVAVNAVGAATTPGTAHFWAAAFEQGAEFGGLGPDPRRGFRAEELPTKLSALEGPGEATTIAIVATDAALTKAECHRLAVAAHDGLARALVPAHTPFDGDLVFALSTGTNEITGDRAMLLAGLGASAADCLARAIARGVYAARAEPGDLLPCWSDLRKA
ncbi:P1 family peptidase [Celeribacter neptunius]|uniref:D-aminopeptidase n=1 Tax=Celeribacter neptunius TaxID=588602 RepID=A0A1I3R3I9_9RHOB|nr:P1 family peptidase [Celeribacter neptunius]SFJ40302.1 D-aminopeptidase [Celeribacter neptunius]